MEYGGIEKLVVNNGQSLVISNTGSSIIPTSQKHIQLHDMLHFSHIKMNLLSIDKLTYDNNVIVDFNTIFFLLRIKLQGSY